MSSATIATMYLAGEKKRVAWLVGLLNQCLWFAFIYMTKNWGLVPMSVAVTVVYARNFWRWRKWKQKPRVTVTGDINRGKLNND